MARGPRTAAGANTSEGTACAGTASSVQSSVWDWRGWWAWCPTHQGTQNGFQGGPLYWQDCTRAVKGGYWQTVTIVSNRSNQVIGAVSATIDSI